MREERESGLGFGNRKEKIYIFGILQLMSNKEKRQTEYTL